MKSLVEQGKDLFNKTGKMIFNARKSSNEKKVTLTPFSKLPESVARDMIIQLFDSNNIDQAADAWDVWTNNEENEGILKISLKIQEELKNNLRNRQVQAQKVNTNNLVNTIRGNESNNSNQRENYIPKDSALRKGMEEVYDR